MTAWGLRSRKKSRFWQRLLESRPKTDPVHGKIPDDLQNVVSPQPLFGVRRWDSDGGGVIALLA